MTTDATFGSPAPRPGGFLRTLKKWFLIVIVTAAVLFGLYTWAAYHYTYSEGDRAGYVQKFSKKGWLCKTWEGELALANLPGAMPEIFTFTVRGDDVAAQINKVMGDRVALHYEQHVGLPTTCFGDTQYFVTSVRLVNTQPGMPGSGPGGEPGPPSGAGGAATPPATSAPKP